MIASLRGVLTELQPGACVIECAGVGYLAHVSSATLAALPPRGSAVRLKTRQIVREDSVMLFGFADPSELELFDLLITVSGVGPKLALAVLSGLRPQALARAIREEQVGVLVQVPGIGRKTAERLVVELRDKLEAGGPAAGPVAAPRDATRVLPHAERWEDAVAALVTLGYTASQAQDAVRHAASDEPELSVEQIVRRALSRLGKALVTPR
ncbi:MAG TPA: Holliday junction branch migration protein RuvA [Candidatus Eisenbacteria bacterium]|nr:Holliday junction branch migration protein RuvA [Candidatus Eisenbacteria bacterium]